MQEASKQKKKPEAQDKADRQWFHSVGLRTITALVGIPVVLVVLWLGGWWAFATAALVTVLAIYELHTMTLHEGYHPVILVSLALSFLFLVAAMLPQQRLLLLEIGISVALLVSFPILFMREKLEGAMVDWSLTMAIAVYLGWPMSFLLLLRGYQAGLSDGLWWLLMLFGGVWGFDTGAFFAGHFFGRHKLAPIISPGKTWEGVFGGLLFSVIAGLLFTTLPMGVPWYLAVLLGLLVGVAATLGDLAESLIKRQTHVKDSGQFFPGHGGILDRIDSILFAVLVVYIFAQLIGKI
ncbi:MAG TPA: phosphatidate cytidylyltransferase [Ktedonobacteraceae bacterium]|nr:phosphatidate cytidylyltransferase [Ktedonobacteraceae bacterium]